MYDSRFVLYKLYIRVLTVGQEYVGLWGGIFGWFLGKFIEDKFREVLFFLVFLYYEEFLGQRCFIVIKILEGIYYVLYLNGLVMFIVNVDEFVVDLFFWDVGVDLFFVSVK